MSEVMSEVLEKQDLILVAGPPCVGKTALVKAAVKSRPELLDRLITSTSRNKRLGEVHGEHYYFHEYHEFERMIEDDELFEHNRFKGNSKMYGCSRAELQRFSNSSKTPIAAVDLEGAKKFLGLTRDGYVDLSAVNVKVFYITADRNELVRRLIDDNECRKRNDSARQILQRIEAIEHELAQQHLFHPDSIISNNVGNLAFDLALNTLLNKVLYWEGNRKKVLV